jgi:hypothetical protein
MEWMLLIQRMMKNKDMSDDGRKRLSELNKAINEWIKNEKL